MRAVTLVLLFALLAACVSAARVTDVSASSGPLGVSVPFKWCGSSGDDGTIQSIQSNEFPPVKGDTLTLNVTGNLTKQVTSGTYTIGISLGGFPLPSVTGDIAEFHPLPWAVGELNFTYAQTIPSESPSGSYQVKISAVDQDKKQIFCITIAFTLSSKDGQTDSAPTQLQLEAVQSKAEEVVQRLGEDADVPNQRLANLKVPTIQNLRRSMRQLKPVKPVKSGRRL